MWGVCVEERVTQGRCTLCWPQDLWLLWLLLLQYLCLITAYSPLNYIIIQQSFDLKYSFLVCHTISNRPDLSLSGTLLVSCCRYNRYIYISSTALDTINIHITFHVNLASMFNILVFSVGQTDWLLNDWLTAEWQTDCWMTDWLPNDWLTAEWLTELVRSHRSTFPTIVHQNSDIFTKKPPELN